MNTQALLGRKTLTIEPAIGVLPVRRLRMRCLVLLASLLISSPLLAFQMQGLDGSKQFLHDRTGQGRWTLVMIWSLDCVPCEQQKPMIAEFHQAHAGSTASVIGVSIDGPRQRIQVQTRLAESPQVHETLLSYPDVFERQFLEETGQHFVATPTYLLYRPDGELVGLHQGPIRREALDAAVLAEP